MSTAGEVVAADDAGTTLRDTGTTLRDTGTTLRVEGEFTIYRAAELKRALLPLPAGTGPVELDLAEVTEIDTAGIQLLLLARREAIAAGRTARLVASSPAVDEALRLLDVQSLFA
jgi:anti-sigma B factor antagonist